MAVTPHRTPAQDALAAAAGARATEVAADQREAQNAILAVLSGLRDKGYTRQFVQSLARRAEWWEPCTSQEWPCDASNTGQENP